MIRFKYLFSIFIIGMCFSTQAQDAPYAKFVDSIQESNISSYLYTLASDAYEGRETGHKGNEMAASYIVDHMRQWGVSAFNQAPDYLQPMRMSRQSWQKTSLQVNGQAYKHIFNYFVLPQECKPDVKFELDEITFAGYGNLYQLKSDVKTKGVIFFANTSNKLERPLDKRVEEIAKSNIPYIFVIMENYQEVGEKNLRALNNARVTFDAKEGGPDQSSVIYLNPNLAKEIFGKKINKIIKYKKRLDNQKKIKTLILKTDIAAELIKNDNSFNSSNVIGYIPASSAQFKDEYIFVTAHFDHLGKRGTEVFNGADDNGSGSSTILEIMRTMALAHANGQGPQRNVAFIFFTGEEKGLLGSKYYTSHPFIPLDKTVANINVDMVGRVDEAHADVEDYVYVIGADKISPDLHRINEEANAEGMQLELDYTFNDENDPNRFYYRSDHYNFAKNGVPVVFFFTGVHKDYHMTTDTPDKIMFPKLTKICKHVARLTWRLANNPDSLNRIKS